MAWAVFYPPPPTPRSTFKIPLSRAILDDPAFSPDPRSHPHFPLADASSYKALPAKSPPRVPPRLSASPPALSSPSSSSGSDTLVSLSPSSVPTQSCKSPSYSPSDTVSPLSIYPKVIQKPSLSLPVPEILSKLDSTNIVKGNLKPVALQNINIPRKGKGKMNALVRRLTSLHNLDRIDELDETDPFGGSYHHDGPYEAIGSNLAQLSHPQRCNATALRVGNIHHSKRRESHPRPLPPGQHQSASRLPPAQGETKLSLNLEPGQILQQNTIYSACASSIHSVSSQFPTQPNAIITRSDHSRSSSLPNTQTRSSDDFSSPDFLDGLHKRPSLHVPRARYFGDTKPDIRSRHHDRDLAPYAPRQTETTVFLPPRYESRFHSSTSPRSPQRTSQPSFNSASGKTRTTERVGPAPLPHGAQHETTHTPAGSYKLDSGITRSSSFIQNKHSEPLRIHHLPKRLVMPAPLQPQLPQPQHKFPPASTTAWQDEHPDEHAFDGAHFDRQPAAFAHEAKLLRKRSSAFPAKTPIPDHAPMSQDDAVQIVGNSLTKTANEAEGTKERTRRRRLSKRKNDSCVSSSLHPPDII